MGTARFASEGAGAHRGVGSARDLFLRSGALAPTIRPAIRQSWARSAGLGVDAGELRVVEQQAGHDEDEETFERVRDVLSRAAAAYEGEPVSIFFAASTGRVVHRYCGDRGLQRQLEAVSLVPGAGYGEGAVGTNGIGTAIEDAAPTLVVGHEHFSQQLSDFACAGAPLHHPVTGALLGVVDITCAAELVNPMLLGTAKAIAAQLQEALTTDVSAADMALMRDYLATSRRATDDPVLALGGDLLMVNRRTNDLFGADDRSALLSRSAESTLSGAPHRFRTDLPSGSVADVSYQPTLHAGQVVGGVFRVQVDEERLPGGSVRRPPAHAGSPPLPGAVGVSAAWTGAMEQVRACLAEQRTLLVRGERGTGKLTLIKAVHYSVTGSLHLRVLDCAAVRDPDGWVERLSDDLEEGVGTIVLQHLDRLPAIAVARVVELLREHAATTSVEGPHWIVATHTTTDRPTAIDALVAPFFDASVTLPPLRDRPDDVAPLARYLLASASGGDDVRFAPCAADHLPRLPWEGNVAELAAVVRAAAASRGEEREIVVRHLPPACLTAPGRALTRTESLERDLIVRALAQHDGDSVAAAASIGVDVAELEARVADLGTYVDLFDQ